MRRGFLLPRLPANEGRSARESCNIRESAMAIAIEFPPRWRASWLRDPKPSSYRRSFIRAPARTASILNSDVVRVEWRKSHEAIAPPSAFERAAELRGCRAAPELHQGS